MARRTENTAAEALDEIESIGDRLAEWVGRNPALVLGSAIVILVLAAAWGVWSKSRESALDEASAEMARVDTEYREAMGSPPDSFEIVEPANPETARRARSRAAEQYLGLADRYRGTAAGALAALEAGQLQSELGENDAALATWRSGVEAAPAGEIPRAMLWARIGSALEERAEWTQAAEAYRSAFEIEAYPLRYAALLDSARCLAEAGEREAALQAFERAETEALDLRIPDHIRIQFEALRAAG